MGRRRKRKGIPLDGLLLVDKPRDWTSHDVVHFVRGRYRLAKVGHGGTLDPMATGLLVLLLGKGTKQSEAVMRGRKTYQGTLTLGVTTHSQDAEGDIAETRPVPEDLTRQSLEALLPRFTGDIEQIPPMVSALKKDGKPLYKLAREGKEVHRDPRPVTIHSFEITALRLPEVDIRVECSKGTYIRTLAHDLGQALGCGAHLSDLRRTASGDFRVSEALPVESLRDLDLEEMKSHLLPVDSANSHSSSVTGHSSNVPDGVNPNKAHPGTSTNLNVRCSMFDVRRSLYESYDSLPQAPLVLAIGAFDGLHLGHEHVIQTARKLAASHQARTGIMRFHPHPSRVLYPDKAPALLCSEDQIPGLLNRQQVDLHLRLPFDATLASQTAETFLRDLFDSIPQLKGIVVGPNWRFGHRGRGDVTMLRQYAAPRGVDVEIAAGAQWQGALISSTRIREALRRGDLASATHMLDRHYTLRGTVGHGKKYGRALGFPTANFPPRKVLLPPPGVYAMHVHVEGRQYAGAGYITHEPPLVEVHLLDYHGDLYGKELEVELVSYQRPATPISDPRTLRDRIAADVEQIRELLM